MLRWVCIVVALAAPGLFAEDSSSEPLIEPIDIGFTEQTGRSLLFLDVEAVDDEGRPLTGLVKADFKIRVNYAWRKIYSVDDLCPCGAAAPDPDYEPSDPGEAARLAIVREPPHYVFYFDFSQLGAEGRVQALDEARRWIRDVMRDDDRVMVAAYASDSGLRTLAEFTGDREQLLRAIDSGADDPDMQDPFPTRLGARTAMCADGTLSCYHVGRQEYRHARRGMETLRNFLTDLDRVPQRKAVVLFHENATMFPGRIYGGTPGYFPQSTFDEIRGFESPYFERVSRMRRDSALVPDLLQLEEEVGGTATASRAVLYPILCGTARSWAVNLGANMADQTGGDHNRTIEDLRAVLDEAGRQCPCIYRIGLEMPKKEKSFVLRTKIRVNGKSLPSRYRVQYLTDADRWMRKAQLVMAHPEQWRDLDVRATVLPLRVSDKSWDVSVRVAVELSDLKRSLDEDHNGEWEVAALLADEQYHKDWEMLGVYRVRRDGTELPRGIVLHERVFEDLEPGRYELRAFVRDRAADRIGASRFEIELPSPARGGLAGPVALRPPGLHYRSSLPLRERKRPAATTETLLERGFLPLGGTATILPGEPVQFLTWSCSATPLRAAVTPADGEPWETTPTELQASGSCVEVSNVVETERLPPGSYVYEVTLDGEAPRTARTGFDIVTPAPSPDQ